MASKRPRRHDRKQLTDDAEALDESSKPSLSRRRFLTVATAAPVLTVGARWLRDGTSTAHAQPVAGMSSLLDSEPVQAPLSGAVPSPPSVEEIFDIGDALVYASQPTMPLVELEVGEDGLARFDLPRLESGQGVTTALGMIVAEELDLPLDDVVVTLAEGRPELFFNQLTAGSSTIRAFFDPLRVLAATARLQLVLAAAEHWGLSPADLRTRHGQVEAPDGRALGYGELSRAAAAIANREGGREGIPKPVSEYRTIGVPHGRVDGLDIVTGRKKFAMDLDIPRAIPTMVRRAPWIKGRVTQIHNAAAVEKMPGVVGVVPLPTGVAVAAETFEQARAGASALRLSYDPGPLARESNDTLRQKLEDSIPPFEVPPVGPAGETFEATIDWAPLYHAFLETETAVADVRPDGADVWMGFQAPIWARQEIAKELGLPVEDVHAHVVPAGGAFGRRAFFDGAMEAVRVSSALGRPVKLMWPRIDDVRHGRVRPPEVSRFRANVLDGKVVSFEQRVSAVDVDFRHGLGEILTAAAMQLPEKERMAVGNEAFGQAAFATMVSSPYNFGSYTKRRDDVQLGTWTGAYRSVPCQPARAAEEIVVDELAALIGADPVEFRRVVLKSDRARAVLDAVVKAGKWGRPLPDGIAQGVGIHKESKTYTAALVELDARNPDAPKVTRATLAVDIGLPINPLGLKAQMEGCLVDAISVTLSAGLHIVDGLPLESSYADYRFAKMADTPRDVNIIIMPPNGEHIGGAGEVGFAAPSGAIANAYARATGRKPRSFPLMFDVDFDPIPPGELPGPIYLSA